MNEQLELFPNVEPVAPPSDVQIGGDHYKKMPIQPLEYAMANGLDACQTKIVKYVTRFRDKGGVLDLQKAAHVLAYLIDWTEKYGTGLEPDYFHGVNVVED